MSSKFIRRTLRNVVVRNHPYFAHLAITHRCNLKCRCCHVAESKFAELDTAGMKKVIDRLDEMGVGVMSISGGGEPLLRSDFDEIINYAADKGLYTKITSNGTMPQKRYEQLLRSRIKEIGISLDGVEGNDLPFSHTGPRILDSLRYIHDHLPAGKQLTINVTVTAANHSQVRQIVDWCAREYPRAKVWLNPVVTGAGALRTATAASPNPDYLRTCKSANLLSAEFYTEGVEEQARDRRFDWGCLAGETFFDIKPNGDFWLCQDTPSRTPLNILQPDFLTQLRKADFSHRRQCSGCTYSCYYVTQKGLSPKTWKDMGTLWWRANTVEGDASRETARRYGWVAGLLAYVGVKAWASAAMTGALLLALAAVRANAETRTPEEILACMEQATEQRGPEGDKPYISERVYTAGNAFLRHSATLTAEIAYSPGEKTFRILSRSGSGAIQKRVLEPLLAVEVQSATPETRIHTDIHHRNYQFRFVRIDEEDSAFVYELQPKTKNRLLFKGQIWVDSETCGVRRVAGEPAVSPSFLVRKTAFVHEYARFGDIWLPAHHRSDVQLHVFGKASLEIDYHRYSWPDAVAVRSTRAWQLAIHLPYTEAK